jgi:hypothetical protein
MMNTDTDTEAYLNQCVDLVFPFQLYLRENKRLTTPEDKEKLRLFKRDIFYRTTFCFFADRREHFSSSLNRTPTSTSPTSTPPAEPW